MVVKTSFNSPSLIPVKREFKFQEVPSLNPDPEFHPPKFFKSLQTVLKSSTSSTRASLRGPWVRWSLDLRSLGTPASPLPEAEQKYLVHPWAKYLNPSGGPRPKLFLSESGAPAHSW